MTGNNRLLSNKGHDLGCTAAKLLTASSGRRSAPNANLKPMILDALQKLANDCTSLTRDEAREVMLQICVDRRARRRSGPFLWLFT